MESKDSLSERINGKKSSRGEQGIDREAKYQIFCLTIDIFQNILKKGN